MATKLLYPNVKIYAFLLLFLLPLFSYSQTTIWEEDFSTYIDGTTTGTGSRWTTTTAGGSDWFEVRSNGYEGKDLDGQNTFTTEDIDISGYTNVSLSVDISELGSMENSDFIRIYYQIDTGSGYGAETYFATNGNNFNDFGSRVASQTGLNAQRVRIIIRVDNDRNDEYHRFDNILVEGTPVVAGPEINLVGNGTNITSGDTAPSLADDTDFGAINVISGTNPNTFILENTGTADLTITSVTSDNGTEFAVSGTTSGVITAGNTISFIITFDPSAVGTRTGIITIVNDDGDEDPYTFGVQGNGVEQEINIQGGSPLTNVANGDSSPTVVKGTDFGSTSTGFPITSTFTIENTGDDDLAIGAISFSGTNAGDFTITAGPSSPISGSGSTTFTVSFNPSNLGTRIATISIVNNDNDENPYTFDLQGTGASPTSEINLQGGSPLNTITNGNTAISVTDGTDFGSVDIAGAISHTFTIQNTGAADLTISSITSNDGAFTIGSITLPATITAGSSATFNILFDPSALITYTATITINNDDGDENPYTFNVEGIGNDICGT